MSTKYGASDLARTGDLIITRSEFAVISHIISSYKLANRISSRHIPALFVCTAHGFAGAILAACRGAPVGALPVFAGGRMS